MSLSKQQILRYLVLIGVGTAVGVGAAYLSPVKRSTISSSPPSSTTTPILDQVINNQSSSSQNLNFVPGIVDRVGSVVVRIDSVHKSPGAGRNSANPDQDQNQDPNNPQDEESEKGDRGTGSGFIFSADGQILTNAHVVDDTSQVTVTLKDGRMLPGKVLGSDPVTDLAVIKVAAQSLPIAKLGDSGNLTAGQWAIAIGNPLGLDNSVTLGIISATGRSSADVGIPDKRVRYIQSDAAINPGNSGGPLLNTQGEVIGINTAIRADGQGLGFAIPIQTAQRVAKQILATGQASHPYLGIKMVERTPELLKKMATDPQFQAAAKIGRGVIAMEVLPNTPAAKGGLQTGDVIQKVGDKVVNSPNDLQEQMETSEIGQPLPLEINRAGQVQTLQVQPEVYPSAALNKPAVKPKTAP
jgi:S1-C subfamily serine protease